MTSLQNRIADKIVRGLKMEAQRTGRAKDGAITCECRTMRRRSGQIVASDRYTFKLNGTVVSKINAAKWIDPDADYLRG